MHATAWPDSVELGPGEPGIVSLTVTNTSTVIDAYHVQVFGLDPDWVTIEPARISLFPGDAENVDIHLTLPDDYPSSVRTIALNVVSEDDPGRFALTEIQVGVSPRTELAVTVDPVVVTAGRRATFGVVVSNSGNASAHVAGTAVDPEGKAEFTFVPDDVIVAPGREQVVRVTAQGGRAWFGQPRARTFTFGVVPPELVGVTPTDDQRNEAIGTFIQRPRISRWLITLLGLLAAAAVFAVVLNETFQEAAEQASVSDDVLEQALADGDPGGARIPADPGSVAGMVASSTTGEGLAGVQVELFITDDTTLPIRTAATDDAGMFTLSNLGSGIFKVRVTGAGINPRWFPAAETSTDAAEITVDLTEPTVCSLNDGEPEVERQCVLGEIVIGGAAVEVSGSIDVSGASGGSIGDDGGRGDTTDVTLSLIVAGQIDTTVEALVDVISLAADGSFSFASVPSPGNYVLVVEKPGATTERRDVLIEPGEEISGVEVSLRPGNGLISGTVLSPDGTLGGALVSASDGSNVIETVSLTEGGADALGTFVLRNLSTPSQYTVTISKPGFAPETRTIALDDTQTSGVFTSRLVPALGSIQGQALVGGGAARGLSVTVTGGDVNRTTSVASQGNGAGTYGFFGLPAPATYTLTFSGAGTIPQVRIVDLSPSSGTQNQTGIDVALATESTTVRGVVLDVAGNARPQATVTLSDGTNVRTFLSADEPPGAFEFTGVAPGAYTLTASRTGTVPDVKLVNVSPSEAIAPVQLNLGATAGIGGQVVGINGTADFDPTSQTVEVRLFTPETFPQGTPLARVLTDSSGSYSFGELDAPSSFLVAVYTNANSGEPLDSQIITTEPSTTTTATTFRVAIR